MNAEFKDAVRVTRFDLGKGGWVIRTEHPALPGLPVIGMVEPGKPENDLQAKTDACMEVLHTEFIKQSQDFDII